MNNININEVQNIRGELINPRNANLLIVQEENLFIFFSIDICNSTRLKNNNKKWFEANNILYNENFTPMHLWKFNGDEVLYSEPFVNLVHLSQLIKHAYSFIRQLQNEISAVIKEPSFNLKGTIWLARTYAPNNKDDDIFDFNLHIKYFDSLYEFLGKNIDEGFRLSKKITGNKIAIDPKICYLFLLAHDIYSNNNKCSIVDENDKFHQYSRNLTIKQKDDIDKLLKCIYFINYTKLKGVWKDRGYPVFWYYESLTDLIYDDQMDELYVHPDELINSDWIKIIEGIFDLVGEKDEFLNILRIAANGKSKAPYNLEANARLYYSVACVNPTTKNILVVQRSSERHHLKNVWEFVPYKHTSKAITNSIEQRFYDEFGIRISMLTDGEEEKNILPIHFCTIYRNGQAHNSILCVAKFNGQNSDEEIIKIIREHADKERYIDFRMINLKEANEFDPISIKDIEKDSLAALSGSASNFDGKRCSMYFHKSIQAVSNLYSKLEKGENWFT